MKRAENYYVVLGVVVKSAQIGGVAGDKRKIRGQFPAGCESYLFLHDVDAEITFWIPKRNQFSRVP
jgi:hypothetical protein